MELFTLPVQVRWADLDPNFHLRHSVYYDWGAMCRIDFFYKYGLTAEVLREFDLGPIIFREECVFKKEIKQGDTVKITMELIKARKDYSRWTIQHKILKNDWNNDSVIAALLTIDGAWLDTKKRKLTVPTQKAVDMFSQMQVGKEFQWMD